MNVAGQWTVLDKLDDITPPNRGQGFREIFVAVDVQNFWRRE